MNPSGHWKPVEATELNVEFVTRHGLVITCATLDSRSIKALIARWRSHTPVTELGQEISRPMACQPFFRRLCSFAAPIVEIRKTEQERAGFALN